MQYDLKNLERLLSVNSIHITQGNISRVRELAFGIWDAAHNARRGAGCREMYEAGFALYRRKTDTSTLQFIRGVIDAGNGRCAAAYSLSYSMGYALGRGAFC